MPPVDRSELAELIAIPSISADATHAPDVRTAARWVAAYVQGAGGAAEVVDWNGRPLVFCTMAASTAIPEVGW